jgi:hypothetical protein
MVYGNDQVLAFSGPHFYISSSWYDEKCTNLELYCRSCVWKNQIILKEAVIESKKLVDKYEQNSKIRFHIADLSKKTMMQTRIVAFEMKLLKSSHEKIVSKQR